MLPKTKRAHILEFGSSSVLDHEYDKELINWTKTFNKSKPKFHDELVPMKSIRNLPSTMSRILMNVDLVVFSIGDKGERKKFHEYTVNDIHDLLESNLLLNMELLKELIKVVSSKYRSTPLKVVFLNSISGKDDASYENHSIYAALKAAMSSIVRTIKTEYSSSKFEFIDLKIPYTQSKMTTGQGESPDELRTLITNLALNKSVNLNKFL